MDDAGPMEDERPPQPVIEQEETADGRYVLYFSWADDATAHPAPDGPDDE